MKCQLSCEDFDDALYVDFEYCPREGEQIIFHDVEGREDVEGYYFVLEVRHWVIGGDCDVAMVIKLGYPYQ